MNTGGGGRDVRRRYIVIVEQYGLLFQLPIRGESVD